MPSIQEPGLNLELSGKLRHDLQEHSRVNNAPALFGHKQS